MRLPFVDRILNLPITTRTSKSLPKTQARKLISPWIWGIFISSLLLFIGTVFVVSWTSTGPTLFSANEVNPAVIPSLPSFLQVPTDQGDVFFPTVGVCFLCVLLRFIPPTNATRLVIKSILLLLAARYLVWRTVATLNFSHWVSTAFSLLLYVNEAICFLSFCLYNIQTIWSNARQRSAQADRYSQDVLSGRYLPSVDVFIPSYNEPEDIVRRTAIGCQAIEYPNKTVYILDDTRRPHIRELAKELGCEYITRPDNKHAKAGNLNNALQYTQGELIALMDADFVPFKNFLTRTVGFFKRREIDLVQTRQNFYNPDYHARNLGIDHVIPNDLEHFFSYLQSNRDVGNSVICCGTSYVVRRSSLEAVGGYYTRCCVEDFQTSVLMLTRGARLVYLNETLSMGESTRMYADFIDQRLRWLQGNFQLYCCGDEVPVWSKLNWVQKSYAISQILYCFQSVFRAVFLLSPLLSVYLGISPFIATLPELLYYFVPFLLLLISAYGWTTEYCVSYFWNEVYETIFCFPALRRLCLLLRNPFAKASKVTRKGVKAGTKNYNLSQTWPLLVLLVLTVAIICVRLIGYYIGIWPTLSADSLVVFVWLIYNAVILSVALLSAIDQPVRRAADRFPLRTSCKLTIGTRVYWGHTNNLSETGANLTLTTDNFVAGNQPGKLEFLEHGFSVEAEVVRSVLKENYSMVFLKFPKVNVEQSRQLVTILYCHMTWWKRSKRPGGIDSLLAMLSAVLKLKPVLNTYDR
jgi:cellulose synthase (UDP-forming)